MILYTLPGCEKCKKVKEYLTEKEIPFSEINILTNKEVIKTIQQNMEEVYAPILYYKNQYYDGCEVFRWRFLNEIND
ncbi:glutaredoxin family protein [Alteribacillus bidgolensis]|uniref:Glutaredoxin n=1 Tax=Alteribacillus bidgolensis TaxID=930129 RepID=A0A1G8CWN7_9BACI|nr:glutaredoxin family protein [Alteribacillus bidgolensis]SDH49918.1 Glutaredoxin [Alteribacillus bidgolensis]